MEREQVTWGGVTRRSRGTYLAFALESRLLLELRAGVGGLGGERCVLQWMPQAPIFLVPEAAITTTSSQQGPARLKKAAIVTEQLGATHREPPPVSRLRKAAASRDHVRARVSELTGHAVTDVDIAVVSLPAPPTLPQRRVV